jgi:hypothetical protein
MLASLMVTESNAKAMSHVVNFYYISQRRLTSKKNPRTAINLLVQRLQPLSFPSSSSIRTWFGIFHRFSKQNLIILTPKAPQARNDPGRRYDSLWSVCDLAVLYTENIVDTSGVLPRLLTCTRAWILAERFLTPRLQNKLMVNMHYLMFAGCSPTLPHGEYRRFCTIALQHETENDPLDVLASLVMAELCEVELEAIIPLVPRSLLERTILNMSKLRTAYKTNFCLYSGPSYVKEKEEEEEARTQFSLLF